MAITRIGNPAIADVRGVNFRNIIINGSMDIAQRGTSSSSISSSGSYQTVDRYNLQLDTAGTWTQSQSTDVPTGQGFATSLKLDCTTADTSLAAGDFGVIHYKFEGQDAQLLKKGTSSAEKVTLSFWVKSSVAQNFYFGFQSDNGSAYRYIMETGNLSANTWTKITKTIPGNSNIFLNNDNGMDTDEWALDNGYISIVPTQYDLTDHNMIQTLKKWDL